MAKKNLIYEATQDFYLGGQYIPVGATVVAGHDLLKGRSKLFRPFVPTYGDVPEEPEPEAKPAEKAQAAADQKEATKESPAEAEAKEAGKATKESAK